VAHQGTASGPYTYTFDPATTSSIHQSNLVYAYTTTQTHSHSTTKTFTPPYLITPFYLITAFYLTIMRVPAPVFNFGYTDPQPRDGGAPNPSVRSRSANMFLRTDEDDQPRDGG
jgi:hypothetical protein